MSEDGHGFHLWLIISIFVLRIVQVYTTQDRLENPYKSISEELVTRAKHIIPECLERLYQRASLSS